MKNNRIKFELYNLILDIELRETMTIVSGNSGSGKTFLYNLINEAITFGKLKDCICINFNEAVDKDYKYDCKVILHKLNDLHDKIIAIDQASYVLENAEVAKFINYALNRGNHYLILGRSLPIYTDARYLAKIKANDNHIGIRYLFER